MSENAHDDDPAGTSGIEEGHAPIPTWMFFVIAACVIFFIAYIIQFLTGVQPSTAH